MKICPSCNNTNKDEAKFCTKCGNNIEGQQPINNDPVIPAQDVQAPVNPIPSDLPESMPTPITSNPESINTPSKKKSKGLVNVLAIVAVVAILFFIVNLISNANPVNKLFKGLAGLSKMEKATATTTVNINYDGDEEEGKLLKDMTIKLQTATDINNLLAEVTLDLLYENKSVVALGAGVNNEEFYIDLKDLYKDKFYQEIESLVPDYKDYINDYKIIKKAIDGISLKFDSKEYRKIIKDVLDDDIKGSGNKVTVTLNSKSILRLNEKLLKEAKGDKKLMESIRKNGTDLIKKLLKDKKNFEILDVDDLEDALDILEDKGDFEDSYVDFIDSMLSSINYYKYDLEDISEMKVTFRFGFGSKIKGIDYTAVIEDDYNDETIEIITKTDIKRGANFSKINKKNAVEFEELMYDFDTVVEKVTDNLIKAVKKNKSLTRKIEDISGDDIEDSIEYLMYNVFRFIY